MGGGGAFCGGSTSIGSIVGNRRWVEAWTVVKVVVTAMVVMEIVVVAVIA